MKKRAFTLIELLVVIAIIAILAAILFPVLSQARLSAKKTQSLAQMRQLAASVMMYAGDHDDNFVPSSLRAPGMPVALIWTQGLEPYVKNRQIFIANDSNGDYAVDWNTRHYQSVGYSDATGVDLVNNVAPGNGVPGTEGFNASANFSQAEDSSRTGLFVVTANAPKGVPITSAERRRGYVFNPYNGPNSPDGDYSKGLPWISDVDLFVKPDPTLPTAVNLSAGLLKQVFGRYGADGRGNGQTPVVFADGHTKMYSVRQLRRFGEVVWRFR